MDITHLFAVGAGFLLSKVTDKAVDAWNARLGKVGYAPAECGFFEDGRTADGRVLRAQYFPDTDAHDTRLHTLSCVGELFNDSDTQVLLRHPTVRFIGPDGPHITHGNPDVEVDGKSEGIIAVPPHGHQRISIKIPLSADALDRLYRQTIPVLQAVSVTGKRYEFRLGSVSVYGDPFTVWPRRGNLPVVPTHQLSAAAEWAAKALPGRPVK